MSIPPILFPFLFKRNQTNNPCVSIHQFERTVPPILDSQDGNISPAPHHPSPRGPTCRTSIPSHPTRCAEVHWYDPLIVWRCRDVVGTTPWFSVGFQLTRVDLRPWDFEVKLPGVKTNSNKHTPGTYQEEPATNCLWIWNSWIILGCLGVPAFCSRWYVGVLLE